MVESWELKETDFYLDHAIVLEKNLTMSTIISACWRGSDELLSRVHGSRQQWFFFLFFFGIQDIRRLSDFLYGEEWLYSFRWYLMYMFSMRLYS